MCLQRSLARVLMIPAAVSGPVLRFEQHLVAVSGIGLRLVQHVEHCFELTVLSLCLGFDGESGCSTMQKWMVVFPARRTIVPAHTVGFQRGSVSLVAHCFELGSFESGWPGAIWQSMAKLDRGLGNSLGISQ